MNKSSKVSVQNAKQKETIERLRKVIKDSRHAIISADANYGLTLKDIALGLKRALEDE